MHQKVTDIFKDDVVLFQISESLQPVSTKKDGSANCTICVILFTFCLGRL